MVHLKLEKMLISVTMMSRDKIITEECQKFNHLEWKSP